RANRRAAELDRVTRPAGGADPADDGERDVLGRATEWQSSVDADQQRLRFAGEQALRGEHVLDFRSADAEGEASECAVRAGMGVAANDSHSRQGRAVLRADDVNDPLAQVTKWEVSLGAELADVAIERVDLDARSRIGNALLPVLGRRIMVGRCDDRAAAPC